MKDMTAKIKSKNPGTPQEVRRQWQRTNRKSWNKSEQHGQKKSKGAK